MAKKNNGVKSVAIRALALALIIITAVTALFGCTRNYDDLNYINDDLSSFVTFDESVYKGYDIEINIPPVSDIEVEHEILKTLASKKGNTLYDGKYTFNRAPNAGDKAYIYYRGYELDENGNQIELDDMSNFSDSSATVLTIGSGQFVAGFELGLIGKNPADYSKFQKITEGRPQEGDVVYCTMSYIEEVGTGNDTGNSLIRIDLGDPNVEEKWGIGIADYLSEELIGVSNVEFNTLIKPNGDKINYYLSKVEFVTRCEENPIVVKTVFPYDYNTVELRNKTVYFDVYMEKVLCHETAELNDAFITETLKLTEEYLAEYEGATLAEKYRSYVKDELEKDREDAIRYAAEDEMWEYLKENISVKKYPEQELRRIFDDYYYAHQMEFAENYSSYYESIDTYLDEYYGVSEGGDWRTVLENLVKTEVTEKLIFYTILKMENIVPSEEEYKLIYQKELEYDFEYYGKTRKDYATEEEYIKALYDYEKVVLEYYGKEFYTESVYYNYAVDKMLAFANIVNKGEQ